MTDKISIHAPAWGATMTCYVILNVPRISIHAPAWGATVAGEHGVIEVVDFNPRARVGRDTHPSSTAAKRQQFQSTRPRGARRQQGWVSLPSLNFNPRARVGRDGIASYLASAL